MIAAVTGGRDHWPSVAELERLGSECRERGVTVLRDGDCRTGVDRIARGYVRARSICTVERWPADWDALGDAAGPARNRAMLVGCEAARATVLFAFAGGRGTADCTRAARELGIDVVSIDPVREPRVWNRHHGRAPGRTRYIGRGTPLGNPFRLTRGLAETRDQAAARVLGEYRRWLWSKLQSKDQAVLDALEAIRPDQFVVCSCWPNHCHGEVVVRAWRWLCASRESL